MGAWGAGSFENDTACDWVWDLEETDDLSLVEAALERVLVAGSAYLEAPDAEEALAACEVVARLRGNTGDDAEPVDEWVSTHRQLQIAPALAQKSLAVIGRIEGLESELAELWEQSESFAEWKASIADLKARIGG